MSELKTLKDIEKVRIQDKDVFVWEEKLRDAAIEHIHSWEESLENPFTNDPEWKSWMQSRIDVFKEFFNLTQEDIENGI